MNLTPIDFHMKRESLESQFAAKRYNPAWEAYLWIDEKELIVTLPVGSDDVDIFLDSKNYIYIVSMNTRMWYVGMQLLNPEGIVLGEIFFQSPDEQFPGLMELEPIEIAIELAPYCEP